MSIAPPDRDLKWIKQSLQAAISLELATLPPYLCAFWSIKDRSIAIGQTIRSIVMEEMAHMGLACNMLTAIGGDPDILAAVPTYPGQMPGGVKPELTIQLAGLTREQVAVFMEIEEPDWPPVARMDVTYPSIGAFYAALEAAFTEVRPTITPVRQMGSQGGPVFPFNSLDDVTAAIRIIREEGEGSPADPDPGGELAHYYQFGELFNGRAIVLDPATGEWGYTGDPVPFPTPDQLYPMGPVPAGGWPDPAPEVGAKLAEFNQLYRDMLTDLNTAWATGDPSHLRNAVGKMRGLATPAVELMAIPLPGPTGLTYGPEFRI
ncbi:ferritin-like protein [Actinomycetes bacterium KLBMP 9797]